MDVIQDKGLVWNKVPEIVSTLFEYLPMKNLNACAQVCSSWNDLARNTKKRRNRICWFSYVSDEDDRSCKTAFSEFVDNLAIQPCLALIFRTPPPIGSQRPKICDKLYHPYTESSEFLEFLPLSCVSFISMITCVSATTSDCKETEIKFYDDAEALMAVFFPFLPEVKLYTFQPQGDDFECLQDMIGIPGNETIKCLILFLSSTVSFRTGLLIYEYIGDCIDSKGKSGLIRSTDPVSLIQRDTFTERGNFGIAFTGENVSSASVNLSFTESPDEVEKRLKKYFDGYEACDQCIAFAFTDLSQRRDFLNGLGHFAEFRKMFPTIQLFTIFRQCAQGSTNFLIIAIKNSS